MPERYSPVHAVLHCRSRDGNVHAFGRLEGWEVLVVLSGSTAVGRPTTSRRLVDCGVVKWTGRVYQFLVEFAFPNPTTASDYILGDPETDGWAVWRDESGEDLRALTKAAAINWVAGRFEI